jgi:general secretion pathway protein F
MALRERGRLSLEQWIALNDEIAALVRAGLPLERGLAGAGAGRMGTVARSLSERLEGGATLDEALEAEGDRVPPIYRAVVRAGVRSGRLASALEGLTAYARSFVEMRRVVGLALLYPLLVLTFAYVLLLGFLWFVLPPFLSTFDVLRLPSRRVLFLLSELARTVPYWAPIPPIVLALLAITWLVSGRARSFPAMGRMLRWVPGARTLMRQVAAADFADLLAVLVEHEVPLPEAVELAANATGDPALRQIGPTVADALRRGEPPTSGTRAAGGFPPLLRWVLAWGTRQGMLAPALRNAAEMYRRRARLRADLMRTLLPTAAMVIVGATAALLYTLTLFVPFSALLRSVADTL